MAELETGEGEKLKGKKKEVAVIVGRAVEFYLFAEAITDARVFRSTMKAETPTTFYRGYSRPELAQGIRPNEVIRFGTYYRTFTHDDIEMIDLACRIANAT